MSKIIKYNAEAREKIKSGVDQVAEAVKITLGPKDAMSFWTRASDRR